MDGNTDAERSEPAIDWTEPFPDLPHLFARVSELVLGLGHHPAELVVMPRAEADRREASAFTAGWAEAMSGEMPRVRLSYEKRIAEAYAQGQRDARGLGRPRRTGTTPGGDDEAKVIPLPLGRFLEAPAPRFRTGERVRGERSLPGSHDRAPEPDGGEPGLRNGFGHPAEHDPQGGSGPRDEHGRADEPGTPRRPEPGPFLSAREMRDRKGAEPVGRVLRGRRGRPIVPPLGIVPAQRGRERPGSGPASPGGPAPDGRTDRTPEPPPDSA
jgi:hypothetical protein